MVIQKVQGMGGIWASQREQANSDLISSLPRRTAIAQTPPATAHQRRHIQTLAGPRLLRHSPLARPD